MNPAVDKSLGTILLAGAGIVPTSGIIGRIITSKRLKEFNEKTGLRITRDNGKIIYHF